MKISSNLHRCISIHSFQVLRCSLYCMIVVMMMMMMMCPFPLHFLNQQPPPAISHDGQSAIISILERAWFDHPWPCGRQPVILVASN